jgi:RNA polymerase sporulation-specific sigma factor
LTRNEHFERWKAFAEARAKQTLPDHWIEDGTQEAYVGLLKAIDTFNPETGFKFSTYATHCIRNAIYDFVRREKRQTDNLVYTDKMEDVLPSVDADAHQQLERYQMNHAIRTACGEMTVREEYILTNHMLSDNPISVRMIAEQFTCGKSSINRDINRLKSKIKENYDNG